MKISLFYKTYVTKVCLFLVIFLVTVSIPNRANAGFFSNIFTSVIGLEESSAQTDQNIVNEEETSDFSYNSQTMPLFETSINPDMKNAENGTDFLIVDGTALTPDGALIGSGLENISSGSISVYIVKEGDTLSEIAEFYDVSINTIRWENNITGNNIKIGQELNILPVTGVKHVVKKGDTLDKIANKYDADLDDILIFNDLSTSDLLKEGDILIIPNGTISAPIIKKIPTNNPQNQPISNRKITPGYYIRPAVGGITSQYGPRRGGYHYGVDIGNKRGTTVEAAASGVVVKVINYCSEGKSSCGDRYGNYVKIEHPNGQTTIYAHLAKVYVSVGQEVSQGEKIATIGNTGRSTGPHLHFQIENSSGATIRPQF